MKNTSRFTLIGWWGAVLGTFAGTFARQSVSRKPLVQAFKRSTALSKSENATSTLFPMTNAVSVKLMLKP